MAIYTKISKKDTISIEKKFSIGKIVLFKGILRVDFYDKAKKYLFSKKVFKNNIIMLVDGGHGFKFLKDVEMLEVKQGPYSLSEDKVKINSINEKKIKIR